MLVNAKAHIHCKNFLETPGSPVFGSLCCSSRHLHEHRKHAYQAATGTDAASCKYTCYFSYAQELKGLGTRYTDGSQNAALALHVTAWHLGVAEQVVFG